MINNYSMLLLVDIEDQKADSFMNLIKNTDAKIKTISTPDAALLEEIKEIKKAFNYAKKIRTGKLRGRSADELLNEL